MASTTFSGPVTSTAGFVGTVTGQVVGAALTTGAGTGITTGTGTVTSTKVTKVGNIITTQIYIDLTGLASGGADLDIIGAPGGTANCSLGQITLAESGAIFAGQMTCGEVPLTGADDIDLYSATVATGAEDTLITDLTETALLTSGGAWALGVTKVFTLMPPADDYIYIVSGEIGDATYTAGIFMIELFGYAA